MGMETSPLDNRPIIETFEAKEVEQNNKDKLDIERGLESARSIDSDSGKLIIEETIASIDKFIDFILNVDFYNPAFTRDSLLNLIIMETSKCKSYLDLLKRFGLKINLGKRAADKQMQRIFRNQ